MFSRMKTYAVAFAVLALTVSAVAQTGKTVTLTTDTKSNTVKVQVSEKTEAKAAVSDKTDKTKKLSYDPKAVLAKDADYGIGIPLASLPRIGKYKKGEKRNSLLDWLDAIIFAVIAVTFINIFFFQAFKIPSSSMESSLLTGDHLFVSKLSYGPRVPQTPLTVPFTHNVLPGGGESYSTLIQNGYRRLKGFGHVKRGDYVVFGSRGASL